MIGRPVGHSAPATVLLALATTGAVPSAAAVELGALFSTPAQRAADRFEAGEYEALVEEAPDPGWEGIGRYATGDAAGAADAFARALASDGSEPALTSAERETLLYNRAVAETRAGRLDAAIAGFDELLARDPEHADARHNRDVARALRELEESRSSEDGESRDAEGEEGQEGQEGQEGRGDDNAAGRPGESDGSSGTGGEDREDRGEPDGRGDAGDDDREGEAGDDTAEARAAAEAALEAERRRAEQAAARLGENGTEEAAAAPDGESIRTPSEREQATEQWLRRIDDDPSGLLRRRLERSHREDYPEIGDGDEPW